METVPINSSPKKQKSSSKRRGSENADEQLAGSTVNRRRALGVPLPSGSGGGGEDEFMLASFSDGPDSNDGSGERSERANGNASEGGRTKENTSKPKNYVLPLRVLIFWLFSIQRQYPLYYVALFTTIIVNNLGLLAMPTFIGQFVDTLNATKAASMNVTSLFGLPVSEGTKVLVYLTSASVIVAIGTGLRFIAEEITGARIQTDITKLVFRRTLEQEIDFFNEHKSGVLLSRIMNDTSIVRHITGYAVGQASVYTVLVIGAGTLSFYTSYKLSLILVFIILPVFGVIGTLLHSHIRWIANEIQSYIAAAVSFSEESFSAIQTVKYLSGEDASKREYERLCQELFEMRKKKAMLFSGWSLFISIVAAFGVCVAIWYASTLVQSGELSSGQLWTFIVYMAQSIAAVVILAVLYTDLTALIGGVQAAYELAHRVPKMDLAIGDVISKNAWHGVVKFNNIGFSYPLVSNQMILSNISFELYPGKTLAIVGKSGSGKSTLAKLMMGLYKPTEGNITVDGIDVHTLRADFWRSKIGYVQQEPILFSMSIYENIAFSSALEGDDTRESDNVKNRVEKVAKMANANKFILRLSDGYNTQVGERGAMLSGGQKQKIAIARALMKSPSILILDEATSALDAKSEKKVQKALNETIFGEKNESYMKSLSTIIIAHRLSTVKVADEIIVLEKGEIVERGTHDELYRLGRVYKSLVEGSHDLS